MIAWRIFSVVLLISLIGMGCTAVPDPTPSPQTLAGEGATVMATRPLATATMIPVMPTATATEIPATATEIPATATEIPTIVTAFATPTNTPASTPITSPPLPVSPTPLSVSGIDWTENLNEIIVIDDDLITWSPAFNEFVFDYCSQFSNLEQMSAAWLYLFSEPDFNPNDITPSDLFCNSYSKIGWRSDGNQILLNGLPSDSPWIDSPGLGDYSVLFVMDRGGENLRKTNAEGKTLDFYGWMDNNSLVIRSYRGGGNWIVSIFDIERDEELAWAWIYAHQVREINSKYVATESGEPCCMMSAAVFSTEAIRPIPEPTLSVGERMGVGPYINHLSINEEPWEILYNSRFEDWVDDTNQMLVLTWDLQAPGEQSITTNSALQIWNVDTDELELIIPDAVYGRISPDRHFLVFLTPDSDYPNIQLLDRVSGEVNFAQEAFAETDAYTMIVSAYISFSPNGRTLTFYSPTPELMLYDLETGEFLPPLTAVPYTPLWSPDSSRFVYQHPTDGLSIFDTRTQTAYPLATSGGERLTNPQWSYDGTYLSVTMQQEDGTRDTAVLQIP